MKSNPLLIKSQELQNDICRICENVKGNKNAANAIFQINKSSTSIHANIREANYPQSLSDMLSKLKIAKKECFETEGWLQYLYDNEILEVKIFKEIRNKAGTIRRMLISSCKTIENKLIQVDIKPL